MQKFRSERDLFAIDFAKDMVAGEVLSVETFKIIDKDDQDVTLSFRVGEPTPVAIGTRVMFWLAPAILESDQPAGAYRIRVQVATDTGRKIMVDREMLLVTA